jgi:hypothetical protein
MGLLQAKISSAKSDQVLSTDAFPNSASLAPSAFGSMHQQQTGLAMATHSFATATHHFATATHLFDMATHVEYFQ